MLSTQVAGDEKVAINDAIRSSRERHGHALPGPLPVQGAKFMESGFKDTKIHLPDNCGKWTGKAWCDF